MNGFFDKLKAEGLPGSVAEQLCSMNWKNLEELTETGAILFPAVIQKRRASGEFETIPVRIKVPREKDIREARVKARLQAKKEGLDPELDKDLIESLETIFILSECVRSATTPEAFDPYPEHWDENYDRTSLMALADLMERYSELLNPRPDKISEAEMWVMIARISEARNIAPLCVYGPAATSSLVVGMADLCMSFLELKSSLESSEPSTQE